MTIDTRKERNEDLENEVPDEELDDEDIEDSDSSDDSEESHDEGEPAEVEQETGDETDEEREAIRARRRDARKAKKEAQRARDEEQRRLINTLMRQNQELAAKVGQIESRSTQTEFEKLDSAITEATQVAGWLKGKYAEAVSSQDGTQAADILDKLGATNQRISQLMGVKQQAMQATQRPPAPDPRVVGGAQGWMQQNSWYNHNSQDGDAQKVRALDASLTREGYDPRSQEYWDELTYRVKKELPHRYNSGNNGDVSARSRAKPVVSGSGKESLSGSKSEVRVSPERIAAMKEAGVWDDPKMRAEMIKEYQKWDSKNGKGA